MSMPGHRARIRRAPRVLWRRVGGEVVLLPPHPGSEPFSLAGSGPELWQALEQPRTAQELAQVLASRYAITSNEALEDIVPVLRDLERRSVVVRA